MLLELDAAAAASFAAVVRPVVAVMPLAGLLARAKLHAPVRPRRPRVHHLDNFCCGPPDGLTHWSLVNQGISVCSLSSAFVAPASSTGCPTLRAKCEGATRTAGTWEVAAGLALVVGLRKSNDGCGLTDFNHGLLFPLKIVMPTMPSVEVVIRVRSA